MARTIVDTLRLKALTSPDQLAYVFLKNGETEDARLSYGELDERARALATWLQHIGLSGERAILAYMPGLEFIVAFFGCLYANVVAVPIYAPRGSQWERTLPRFRAIANNAQAALVLTTKDLIHARTRLTEGPHGLHPMRWYSTENVSIDLASMWTEASRDPDDLAFLQYTSGSTAEPRGVIITHNNIIHNALSLQEAREQEEKSVFVSWLPHYHDMGLIGNILHAAFIGGTCYLMSPFAFLQRPACWLKAISAYGATTSGGPNFAYELCARRISAEEKAGLDLSCWTTAFTGSEPIRAETLERFTTAFEPMGFRREAFFPCYGLAEATLFVTGGSWDSARRVGQSSNLVSCGRPTSGHSVLIVNPETRLECGSSELGEIWIYGPSVARGYWNRPIETQETFQARVADTDAGPFLRTGDLGFVDNGELFIASRLKDLIIIRGENYYPQDIELAVEKSHPSLRQGSGAAFSIPVAGEERLVIVQEIQPRSNALLEEAVSAIREAVGLWRQIDVDSIVLIKPGSIPKTTSGKVQRQASRAAFLKRELPIVFEWRSRDAEASLSTFTASPAPDNVPRMVEWLRALVALTVGQENCDIDPNKSLMTYVWDSLRAVELTHRVEATFGVQITAGQWLGDRTLVQVVEDIFHSLPRCPKPDEYKSSKSALSEFPLSHGQQGLWFLQQSMPDNTAYHLVAAYDIQGDLDLGTLRDCFRELISRHPALRTVFKVRNDLPMQRIEECRSLELPAENASGRSAEELRRLLAEAGYTPFNIETGPLFRIKLFSLNPREHILLVSMPHLIADFWSLEILLNELSLLYRAKSSGALVELPPIASNYSDYVEYERNLLSGPESERLWSYWQAQLGGELPTLNLGTGRALSAMRKRGGAISFRVSAEITTSILEIARRYHCTPFTVLLASFQILLYRYSGQDDIIVGSPFAGRACESFSNVVGYFANPIPLRARLAGDLSFERHLTQVRSAVLEALTHQQLPVSLLTQRLLKQESGNRRSLFQVMFVFHQTRMPDSDPLSLLALGQPAGALRLGQALMRPYPLGQFDVQFDMTLALAQVNGELWGSVTYDAGILDSKMAERVASHYETMLISIADQPQSPLSEIKYLPEAEGRQILRVWNAAGIFIPNDFVHQAIEAQVERLPYEPAVIFEGQQITYQALNCRANQLAWYLRSLGVRPDQPVGIFLERSFEMVIAIVAVLKAGGAYLPLQPTYPTARLSAVLREAKPPVALSSSQFLDLLPSYGAKVIAMEAIKEQLDRGNPANPPNVIGDDNLAYVIYTSGSTGQPKGVMNTHRGIRNRLVWMQDVFNLSRADRVLQKTPFSFDVSVWEFLWPIMNGACLVLARPGGHQDPHYLTNVMADDRVTTVHFVPSMLRAVLDGPGLSRCTTLKRVICSGETLPRELQEEFLTNGRLDLYNLYGPTEAAIDVTFWKCEQRDPSLRVPIGRPIHNTRIFVLDQFHQLLPPGVTGELYIAGEGLARGYCNRPDLTAERFIPNPYPAWPGESMYRTGDLARYRSDGVIEFLGRCDNQIKIRGFRVELDEITAVLEAFESVHQAIVVPHEDALGLRLIAYIVAAPDTNPKEDEIRSYLNKRLPDYMLPSATLFLDVMPLNANGKLDRSALPPPPSIYATASEFVAPRTPIEEAIAGVWADTLGIDRISVQDNFFALGGHSLLMTRVVSRLRDLYGFEIPMQKFFQGPTIAEMAVIVIELAAEKVTGGSLVELLEQVERMSNEDVRVAINGHETGFTPEADLYRCADVEIFGSGSRRFIYSKESLTVRGLPANDSRVVENMRQFVTIQDYAATAYGSLVKGGANLRSSIEALADEGFLVSRSRVLSDICGSGEASVPSSCIDVVGFITNNRVNTLRRAITSYIEHFKDFGRHAQIVIMDNSCGQEVRSACRHMLAELQNHYAIDVAYAGLEEKMRFAAFLKRRGQVSNDVIDFALFGRDWAGSRAGANRNALLLQTVGNLLLSLDDDSVCRYAALPDLADGIRLYSESPGGRLSSLPSRVRSFRDPTSVLQVAKPLTFDLLQAHERHLGRSVNDCVAAVGDKSNIDLDAVSAAFLRRLRNGRSRVLVTLNGLIGDCGWASPSPYLFLRDESLDEIVRTEEEYHSACVSRNLLRVVDRVTIADRADEMMTLFTGLDNRHLLPPFVPVGRGQDAVFGATLGEIVPEGCVCYLPWALLHLPPESRRFWPGETLRSASGMPLSLLLSACIRRANVLQAPGDPAETLRRLGSALEHLGMLPVREFREEVRRRACHEVAILADEIERLVAGRGDSPKFWAVDAYKFLDVLQESTTKEEFFVPVDLLYNHGVEEALRRTHHTVLEFGRLLKWWPELVELSRNLQSEGIRLAQPVA